MGARRAYASIVLLGALAGCTFVATNDAPCDTDNNCPTGFICGGAGKCVAGSRTDAGTSADSGVDAGKPDSGEFDGGAMDSGPFDAGPRDAGGSNDAGPVDGGEHDAGPIDAGPEDGGPRDAGNNPLQISAAVTDHALYSAKTGFSLVTLTFDTTESVSVTGATLTVTVGNPAAAMSCPHYSASAPNYTCTYTVKGTETPGVQPISIHATDAVGNTASASASTIFQFQPSLSGTPVVTYVPAAGNVLSTVWAATTGTAVKVSFVAGSALSATPHVVSDPAGFTFTTTGTGPDYTASMTVPTGDTSMDGTYSLDFTLADTVGNTKTLSPAAPTFIVMTSGFGAPYTEYGGLVYNRVPWGDAESDGTPSFTVTGFASNFGAIFVYDGPDPATANLIGSSILGVDAGYYSTELSGGDRTAVYVAGTDIAGNLSAVNAVHDVQWTATFEGKVAGVDGGNPNVMLADPSDPLITPAGGGMYTQYPIYGAMNPAAGLAPEISNYSGLYSGASSPLTTKAQAPGWFEANQASSPSVRTASASAYDSVRAVTVLFGGNGSGEDWNDTWEWDGTSWTAKLPATKPSARSAHAMVYDAARGVTVLFGGSNGSAPLNDTWEWNGVDWIQKAPAVSPGVREFHAMAYDGERRVTVLFGGSDGSMDLADTWEWDGSNWTIMSPELSPSVREGHGMAYDSERGVTVLFGGNYSGDLVNDTWSWDGTNWTQLVPNDMNVPDARWKFGLAYDSNRGVSILYGGTGSNSGMWNDMWEWNGTTWIQRTPGDSPKEVTGYAMSYDSARGRTVLFGGCCDQSSNIANLTWQWDGTYWTQPSPGINPPARYGQGIAFDSGQGATVIFGGAASASIVMDDTWQWNGFNWAAMHPAKSPPARYEFGMAFHAARGVTMIFGGDSGSGPLDDTWKWDGVTWTAITPATSPPPREQFAMSYDSVNDVTVLFGGFNGVTALDDTWEWDGSNWVQFMPQTSPPARDLQAMAFDSKRAVTVLFGGCATSACPANDTWEWDGNNWTQIPTTSGPTARQSHAMAFDPLRGVMVLTGGEFGGMALGDTWLWNGTQWSEAPANNLTARAGQAMAYDSALGQTVLFGGVGLGNANFDDTWMLASALNGYPTDIARFDFAATGETFATAPVEGMSYVFIIGGTGYSASSTAVTGASFATWDNSVGGWRILNVGDGDAVSPSGLSAQTDSPWEATRYLSAPSQSVDLAVFPVQSTGAGRKAGALAVNDVELTVYYEHVESPCTFEGSPPTCVCASDETQCRFTCVDTGEDPLNCGGCAGTDGGTVCTGGMWCYDGTCQCPDNEWVCAGVCTDTSMDSLNCGGCSDFDGGASDVDGGTPAGVVCGGGTYCYSGNCMCPGGMTFCSGSCTDTDSDPLNCGGCGGTDAGAVCSGATPICEFAVCVP